MILSESAVLVYVLKTSGVRGHLMSGRIERRGPGALDVFNARGDPLEYLSGKRIRSWCIVDARGQALDGWQEILQEDLPKIFAEPKNTSV